MKTKQTKSSIFIIMFLVMVQSLYSQYYLVTFSGFGQSTTVETVEVRNTTQQTIVTLNGSDTLYLVGTVGIMPILKMNTGMHVYPNPANQSSRIEFYNLEAGSVSVEIIDITGKKLKFTNISLARGMHAFEIRGLGNGIFIVKATTQATVYQQRLINYSQSPGKPQVNYLGSLEPDPDPAEQKRTKSMVEMQYNHGERLVIKGISGEYSHTLSLIPNDSQRIDFEFIDCIDGDGNNYGVVTIGEQVWMAENLKTTTYHNGIPIDYPGTNNDAWQYNISGAYAWLDNDTIWKDKYGGLYNWYVVSNVNGICPEDWHMPSDSEWMELVDYLVSQGFPNQFESLNGAGGALKSCRQVNSPLGGDCDTDEHPRWRSWRDKHGFDEFGFSGLPGQLRFSNGYFDGVGVYGYWWSSSEDSVTMAWSRRLTLRDGSLGRINTSKTMGFSIRCIRDEGVPPTYYLNLEINPSSTGIVTGVGNYVGGEQVNITATANLDWEFINWTDEDGLEVSTVANFVYTMPAYDITLTANFAPAWQPCPGTPTVTDFDGNEYNTVQIGNQCWMKENLKTTHYQNGVPIEYPGSNNNEWQNNVNGAYAWYNNNINWKAAYGALYNWYAANNTNGLCPMGWYVASLSDWEELIALIGGANSPNANLLKSCRQLDSPLGIPCNTSQHPRWNQNATNYGTDDYSFSALPGSFRFNDGTYTVSNVGYSAGFWTSTQYSAEGAWLYFIVSFHPQIYKSGKPKNYGYSVRCIKE